MKAALPPDYNKVMDTLDNIRSTINENLSGLEDKFANDWTVLVTSE